jgi:hypothetical protein
MIAKLQYENADLKNRLHAGEEALATAKRITGWRQSVIRVVFLALSVTTVLLLARLGILPRQSVTALVVVAISFLLLILPLDRVVELTLGAAKWKGKVVMKSHEDRPTPD